jgi:hypothetical protein
MSLLPEVIAFLLLFFFFSSLVFPSIFHYFFIHTLWLLQVSSLAYPNLLGIKMLCCCCCCNNKMLVSLNQNVDSFIELIPCYINPSIDERPYPSVFVIVFIRHFSMLMI